MYQIGAFHLNEWVGCVGLGWCLKGGSQTARRRGYVKGKTNKDKNNNTE